MSNDPGEQTVWVACGWSGSDKRYHTTKDDCHAARKASTLRETTLAEAEAYGFEECRTCNGNHEVGEYDTSYQRALKDAAKSD